MCVGLWELASGSWLMCVGLWVLIYRNGLIRVVGGSWLGAKRKLDTST